MSHVELRERMGKEKETRPLVNPVTVRKEGRKDKAYGNRSEQEYRLGEKKKNPRGELLPPSMGERKKRGSIHPMPSCKKRGNDRQVDITTAHQGRRGGNRRPDKSGEEDCLEYNTLTIATPSEKERDSQNNTYYEKRKRGEVRNEESRGRKARTLPNCPEGILDL